ncbi:MAG: glycoside hydrolase family 2 [Clostridia bacterium]|nr:glycoside hydrolase family 2 [Clostridia bacterium]
MRKQFDLTGSWLFQTDPLSQGLQLLWPVKGLPDSHPVEVPHIWQAEQEGMVHYCGDAWYAREIQVSAPATNQKIVLHFDAVDYQCQVWVNGRSAGQHEGGFSPFEFDITDLIIAHKPNQIIVKVHDPEDNTEIPIGKQGSWYTRISGIWQKVYLEYRDSLFVESVQITPDLAQSSIHVLFELNDVPTDPASLLCKVCPQDEPGTSVFQGTFELSNRSMEITLPISDMILWEPENPFLYQLELTVSDQQRQDRFLQTFGMREISHQNGQLLLNGKPLFIRGALEQGFYPDTIYTLPTDEAIVKEIQLAKQMGFNLLRKHIKAEIPRYLEWADRLGMLIWAEAPNYIKWTTQSKKRFERELFDMVKRDFNHPSIIIWSIYNEEWGLEWDLGTNKEKQDFLAQFYDRLKAYDPTRLICDNSGWAHVKTDINDYHRYFTAPEQIAAWEQDLDDYILQAPDRNFVPGIKAQKQPIIVSEFGVWGLPSVEKIKQHYGSYPWWFINQGDDTHRESFKQPALGLEKFQRYGLARIFGDFENLATHSQERMFRANKALIEEMRKRPEINGYVVTELSDIEWETNGWLDFFRNPKAGFEKLKDFNGALVILADHVMHNLWAGETQAWDVVISNHDGLSCQGSVQWQITGTDISGSFPVDIQGDLHLRFENAICFTAPSVPAAGFFDLQLTLIANGRVLAENHEELTVSPQNPVPAIPVSVQHTDETLAVKLKQNGLQIVASLDQAQVLLTDHLDQSALEYVQNGGKLIFLAEAGDSLAEKGFFSFRQLKAGEDWDRTSSFNYVDDRWFGDLPLKKEMGWEVDGIFPDYIIPFDRYSKPSKAGRPIFFNADSTIDQRSEVLSGYFQGWIGINGGSILRQQIGQGQLLVTTWRLASAYGVHPIGTQILNRMIAKMSSI